MNEQGQVILLHGLWMRGFALALLQRRLLGQDFAVHRFDYMSVVASQQDILDRLREQMRALGPGPVHLVGHSLGGLLALRALAGVHALPPGRVVCLGSPLKGSAAARRFAGMGRGGEVLLGHNRELLEFGFERWDGARQVGMIAGCTAIGLGAVIGQFDGDNDGCVTVEETRLPGLTDHCVVETSHSGLLISAEVAERAGQFLHHGHFSPVE